MPLYVWLALALLVLAALAAPAVLVVRGLALWRTFKAFGRALEETVGAVSQSAERLAETTARAGSAPERLEPSLERLRVSLARAAVLRSALQDVRDSLGRLAAVYPRK